MGQVGSEAGDAPRRDRAGAKPPGTDLAAFASMAAHELRSPLQVIKGFATLLERVYGADLDEQGRDMIQWISKSASRQEVLINDLMAYAQAVTERSEPTSVALETVLETVKSDLAGVLERSGASLTWDPMPTVIGDPARLARLLANLVDNALKFVEAETTPRVHISAAPVEAGWVISVADNGIGIGAGEREEVFRSFTRLHARDHYAGSGLGLATCREIVESAGGRIWADAGPDGGSVFYFTVAASASPAPDAQGSKR